MSADPVLAWLVDELLDVELPVQDAPPIVDLIKRRVAQLQRGGVSSFAVLPELFGAQQWGAELRDIATRVISDIATRGRRADLAPLLTHPDREVRLRTVAQILPRADPSGHQI